MASVGMIFALSGFENNLAESEDEAGPFPTILRPPQKAKKFGSDYRGLLRRNLAELDPFMAWVVKAPRAVIPTLPRGSPYVGFKRHAPPSPVLTFTKEDSVGGARRFELLDAGTDPEWLPTDILSTLLAFCAEVRTIPKLSCVSPRFADQVQSPEVWRGRRVRVGPQALELFAPKVGTWLAAWNSVSALVLPNSKQLLAEVSRQAPNLEVEVSWRFEEQHTGVGIKVMQNGASVLRVADEELVAIASSPIVTPPGKCPYIEVRIDKRRPEAMEEEELNDMGIGFTACNPSSIREIGAVAAEIPTSWVVDFTNSFVLLTVNNSEVDKKFGVSSVDLQEGNMVGLRLRAQSLIEIYINGELHETLNIPTEDHVPLGVPIYPLFDLYGQTEQISCTGAEEPMQMIDTL
jgi:hypothetical protein